VADPIAAEGKTIIEAVEEEADIKVAVVVVALRTVPLETILHFPLTTKIMMMNHKTMLFPP
jgi:hypothetical protein